MKKTLCRLAATFLLLAAAVSFLSQTVFAQSSTSPAYDVVLLIGQSNMVGVGTGPDDAGDAAVDPRIQQWQPYTKTIIPAFDPIYHNQSLDYVGLPLTFAKAYAKRMAPGRQLLLVGAATGSMGFSNGYWLEPSGTGVVTALSWVTSAMTAAGPNSKFVGILWHQGEEDILDNGGAAYATNLANLISYLRANVPGATSTTPFVVGEHTYAWLTSNLGTSSAVTQQNIILNDDHTLPDSVPFTAWTSSAELPADATYGPAHFSALSYRQFGRRYADKFFEAQNNLPEPQVSQKWWAGTFYDDGRGLGSANTNTIPVNNPATVTGTVNAAIDPVRANVAQISQGQGYLSYQVPGTAFNASYSKMAWFLPGATGYTNNLVSASNSGQTHFLSAQTVSSGTLLIAAGHSSGSVTPIVSAQVTNPVNTWINVAVTYDSVAQVMTLYVNGAAVATQSNVAVAPSATASSEPLLMGSIGATGTTGLDGEMAGNRAWTTALTAAQISSIYKFELPGTANQPAFGIVAGSPSEWALYSVPYTLPSVSIAAASGSIASEPVAVVPNNGFTGTVSLAISGLPTGLSATFAAGKTANTYTLQLSVSSALTAGTYPLIITGSSANNVTAEAALSLTVVNTAGETQVSLSSSFNHPDTIVTDGTSFTAGSADGSGYAYSANLLGSSVLAQNALFTLGPANAANAVVNATVPLPSGNYYSIALLGSSVGTGTGQTFTVTYTDGTTTTFTQSLSNWCSPQNYPGETIAANMPYRNYYNGTQQNLNCFLYSYVFPLDSTRTTKSFTLPNNAGILILGITVSAQTTSSPSFMLTGSPASLDIGSGGASSSIITITPVNGFSGAVSLSASGLPSGVTASFSSGSAAGASQLTLTAGATVTPGSYLLTITGTSANYFIAKTSLTLTVVNTTGETSASLAGYFNHQNTFVTDGTTFTNGGADGSGYSYSATLLGPSVTAPNAQFTLGPPNAANSVANATVALPSGNLSSVALLGAGIGNQTAQTFTVTYSDGTTSVFTQSLSNWCTPQSYTGETIALTMPYRDFDNGTEQSVSCSLYSYVFTLNSSKIASSITLPNNNNVLILAITVTGNVVPPPTTSVSLASVANVYGIFSNGATVTNGGLDTASYAYSANLVGTSLTFQGIPYSFGTAGTANVVSSATVTLPSGNYTTLSFLGTAIYGNYPSESFVVNYADGTSTTFTQGMSDWGSPQSYTGETIALNMAYRLTSTGAQQAAPWYLYAYSLPLNSAKTVKSLVLPNDRHATVLAVTLSGLTGTTAQTITFTSIATQVIGTPLTLAATATSGLSVSYTASPSSVCSVSGSTASFLATGTCTITASQAGNTSFAPAASVSQSFAVLTSQSITFSSIAGQTVGKSLTLAATASSGLAVSYSASPASVCSVSGSTASFAAGGTCTITASQAGNTTYAAATPVSQSFAVQATQTITFGAIATQKVGKSLTLAATASSGLAVGYAASPTSVCSVSGSTASFLAGGTCTITASQAGSATYVAATPVSQSFTVQGPQTITFAAIATQAIGKPLTLTATASSGLAVTYTASPSSVCSVSGSTASFAAKGTCTITASQAGNASFTAATSVSQSFAVLTSQTITFSALSTQTVGTPLTLAATASSGLAITYAASPSSVCSVSGVTASFPAAGTCTITASQAGNTSYAPAAPISQSFAVQATQTITFSKVATQTVGTPLTLTATASSTLSVSYAASPSTVCSVSGTTVSFPAAGTCTITASQAGNATYKAAAPVTQSFTVQAAQGTSTTNVSLASVANIYGIFKDGAAVTNGGLDNGSYAYSATLLGTSLTALNLPYTFGTPGSADAISSVTLTLPSGSYTTLGFLATGVFGNQTSQAFTVTYTDGTTTALTQSISDWGSPQSYSGETTATTMTYRLTSTGAQQAGAWNLYAYSIALNSAKTVKSFTLPNNRQVVVLAVTLRAGNTTPQTITFNSVAAQTVDTSTTLSGASASSGLPVTYTSTTTPVCTVSNTTAFFLSTGTCTLTASQPGSVTYAAATPVNQTFTIQAAPTAPSTTICQAQQTSGSASYCSDSMPGPVSNGYNSLPSWTNLGKTLSAITVSDDQVWGIDASGTLWYLPNFKTSTTWTQVATGVAQVSIGHSLVCRINTNSHLLCGLPPTAQNSTVTWADEGVTSYTQVAVSAGTKLWAVDSSNNLSVIADYTHASTTTTLVAPSVQSVAADGRGLLCYTDLSNNVYCSGWLALPTTPNASGYYSLTNWVNVGKQLQNIAAADNKVYGTDSSGNVWLLPDYTNSGTWEEIASGGVNDKIAAASIPSSFQPTAFASGEVAVMIFMGQSNATGLNSWPTRFLAPSSPNVWGVTNQGWNYLAGNGNGTTPFTNPISSISSIQWSNWLVSPTTMSDMNLGFNTENDGSAANYAAYQWQALIDAGAQLPDLYVIHIGWASEGVDANDGGPSTSASWLVNGTSLWQPLLTNAQEPSYALAPFSRRILNLALSNLLAAGKTPRIVGLQWNQWEAEADSGNGASITDAPTNYANLFNGFFNAIGSHFPVQVVKPLSTAYGPANLSAMQTVFASMVSSDPTDYSVLDVSQITSTIFTGGVLGGGDGSVHYNLDTQQWFANQAINACLVQAKCGTRITTVSTTPTN